MSSNRTTRRLRDHRVFPFSSPSKRLPWRLKPLISVVLPVYNHARYLEESLESILAERAYPLELIIIDDGSIDSPEKVVQRFSNDSRVSFYRQANSGLAKALNFGFSLAKGNFSTWTSADNLYVRGALAKMADYLIDNPAIELVYANVQLIDDSSNPLHFSGYRVQDQSTLDSSVLLLPYSAGSLIPFNDNFINSCFMFRTVCAKALGDHRSELLGFEDYDFWARLSILGPLAHIDTDEPLYKYRLHTESLTGQLHAQDLVNRQSEHLKKLFDGQEQAKKNNVSNTLHLNNTLSTDAITKWLTSFAVEVTLEDLLLSESKYQSSSSEKPWYRDYLGPPRGPIVLTVKQPQSGDTQAPLRNGYRRWAMFPPVELSEGYKRARDNDFGAVKLSPNQFASVLLNLPDEDTDRSTGQLAQPICESAISKLSGLIQANPEICFVLYCSTASQRAQADALNLLLSENSNLRIIDSSPVLETSMQYPTSRQRSLVYALSSVDLILHFQARPWTISDLLAFWVESAIAAAAGISILTLVPPGRTLKNDSVNLGPYANQQAELLASSIKPPPHLAIFETDQVTQSQMGALQSQIKHLLGFQPEISSLEQWLAHCSSRQFFATLENLVVTRIADHK